MLHSPGEEGVHGQREGVLPEEAHELVRDPAADTVRHYHVGYSCEYGVWYSLYSV
jgi:hypothetical protein